MLNRDIECAYGRRPDNPVHVEPVPHLKVPHTGLDRLIVNIVSRRESFLRQITGRNKSLREYCYSLIPFARSERRSVRKLRPTAIRHDLSISRQALAQPLVKHATRKLGLKMCKQ
jgi:hypothetical protein